MGDCWAHQPTTQALMSRRATQEGEAGGGANGTTRDWTVLSATSAQPNLVTLDWREAVSMAHRQCGVACRCTAELELVDAELYSRSTAASAPGEGCFYLCTAGATAPRSRSGVHGATAQRQPRRWSRPSWPWSQPCARAAPSAPRWRAGWQRPGGHGRASQGAVVSRVRGSRSVARVGALAITSRQQPVA